MKRKTVFLFLATCAMINTALAEGINHFGDRVLDKQEIIDLLAPKIKTRGIKPNISMEIYFEFNSADLSQRSHAQLAPIGEALESGDLSQLNFALEGHTDASGTENYNMNLSQRRAESVGNYLYDHYKIDSSKLTLSGKGEGNLLDPNNPMSAVNRRVSITALSQ